nr:3TM-type holin [Marinibactrum halimedae]
MLSSRLLHPVEGVNNVLNSLYSNDEEKLSRKTLLYRLQQKPSLAQEQINIIEAQHRSFFVSGWRPFVGWICAWNLVYLIFVRDVLTWCSMTFWPDKVLPPAVGSEMGLEIVVALLGLASLRTIEKFSGRAK